MSEPHPNGLPPGPVASLNTEVASKASEYTDHSLPVFVKEVSGGSQTGSDDSVPGTWDIFKKRSDESWLHYTGRMCREGQSVPDAFLTVAASQVGQVMLTCPNALWKSGLVAGCLFMGFTIVMSLFTMYLMNALYVERKRSLLASGHWQRAHQHVTQYHDVLGFHLGTTVRYVAQAIIALQLFATGVAQVIACAADWYSVDKSHSKRELQIIWGAVLQLFCFFPSFKHFRILNLMALLGTTFTAIFMLYSAAHNGYADIKQVRLWPEKVPNNPNSSPQFFFTGGAVLLNALGGHAIAFEMMDAMQTPRQYVKAYTAGWAWTIFLVVPQSIAINLSFPKQIATNENSYSVIPNTRFKYASVGLMVGHQLAAFAYYVTPLLYMWERLIRTHNSPWYIRMPSRLPVSLFIWFIAMAFPFYGSINSLMSAVSVPFTAFVLPPLAFYWIYRTHEQRINAALPPMRWLRSWDWKPALTLSWANIIIYGAFGFLAIAYSLKAIVDASHLFGVFARCYQCAPNYKTLLGNPENGL